MRHDHPAPFPRDVIQDYFNNTCIIHSIKLPFPEAALQRASIGTRENDTCEGTGETDSGPLHLHKPQLVDMALTKSILSPCKRSDEIALSLL